MAARYEMFMASSIPLCDLEEFAIALIAVRRQLHETNVPEMADIARRIDIILGRA
ncbi:MAG: hypothetical protein LUQ44_00685 [Methanothrix sp.]|nr:hypothetical protein [Methanothrix sp.]